MCAGSEAKIRDKEVNIYMGHYGGKITIGDLQYDVDGKSATREELISCLSDFKKEELAVLIADLVDNSDE